ncbi:murein DD-endopeptidase MepM/ murein hydrolase activator NlpD [Desulfobaculum xiamenense]|uniref:Murein DD-endopeptidase MepM/ murein hydrolase activator NlpD n=1 Tax=Desulfobaculum xiamenense TaxID=995050 RepID=A0A846QQW0_9BACT|nr:M23 family metallopeptidase [Desulfobaculum xiamenense]NJB67039.1 murein DD-endopeptidase MepM/ murein hydrolase activator NlpD [Desulfobaculum xiamenense]
MLFRKYDIVVFKENEGISRKFRLRGWFGIALAGLLCALIASNIFFWNYFINFKVMKKELGNSEQTVQEQKTQLLALATKIKTLEKDLLRIRDFDSKLRVMINLDQDRRVSESPIGGPESADFANSYLPMHRQELLARKMHNFLHQLNTEARLEEVRQQELMHVIRSNQDLWAATPSIWPTQGWVSSPFGARTSPFTAKREFHKGIDISAPTGTPIYAPAKGVVTFSGADGGYGLSMMIDHGSGIKTRYAHLHSLAVKANRKVSRGELIAYVGNTGRSTGPHLHYEVRLNGVPVNPMRYVLN